MSKNEIGMNYTFIFLNWNSSSLVFEAINSFLPEDIIIVDNYSEKICREKLIGYCKDNNYQIAYENQFNNVKQKNRKYLLLLNDNYGYSKGNNFGLKLADLLGYKYAIISNPDIRKISNNIGRELVSILESDNQVLAVGPKIMNLDGSSIDPFFFQEHSLSVIFFSKIFYPFYFIYRKILRKNKSQHYLEMYSVSGCFTCFNLKNFLEIDLYDENIFLYGEEFIIGQKAKLSGKRIVYTSQFSVLHYHGSSTKILIKSERKRMRKSLESILYYGQMYRNWRGLAKKLVKISYYFYQLIWFPSVKILKKSIRK